MKGIVLSILTFNAVTAIKQPQPLVFAAPDDPSLGVTPEPRLLIEPEMPNVV